MATTKRIKEPVKNQTAVSKLISYILNPEKTSDEKCVYHNSINCAVVGAAEQFQIVRNMWDKNSGNFAYHFIQSFAPGETTPEEAHQCGAELAAALFGNDDYQVVFATHLDREHLHNHFAVNAVNVKTGKKLQTDHDFIRRMRAENDRICRAHNLSVIEHPQSKGKTYAEWIIEKNDGFTWRGLIRQDIDELLPKVTTLKQLLKELEDNGYTVSRRGKYLRVSPAGTNTFFRLAKLGKGYSEEELTDRILYKRVSKVTSNRVYQKTSKSTPTHAKYRGNFPLRRRGGFRGLYYVYLYRLRKLINSPPSYQRRMPVQARQDTKKLKEFAEDLRLISDYKLDNTLQLSAFYYSLDTELKSLYPQRDDLRAVLTQAEDPKAVLSVRTQITDINNQITAIKKKMNSCERIFARSDKVKTTNKQIKAVEGGMSKEQHTLKEVKNTVTNERNDDNVSRS